MHKELEQTLDAVRKLIGEHIKALVREAGGKIDMSGNKHVSPIIQVNARDRSFNVEVLTIETDNDNSDFVFCMARQTDNKEPFEDSFHFFDKVSVDDLVFLLRQIEYHLMDLKKNDMK